MERTLEASGPFVCARVRIEPVTIEALFDGGDEGAMYSDHAGYPVKYRLSWNVSRDETTPAF